MDGFSKTEANAWKCNQCNKVYLNADEAEDCCIELGEPDELPIYNQAVNTVNQLRARNAELEAANANRCEECGAKVNKTICPVCGAPECCPMCCRIDTLEHQNAALEAEVARLRDRLFKRGEMFNPPCFSCGYNGEGYFNPKLHPCAEKHHKLAKALEASDED